MNIDDLQCFAETYQMRSIKRAASSLFVSHQALSKRITNIERQVGSTLFERTTSGLVPTRAGDLFYEFAVATLTNYNRVIATIANDPNARKELRVVLAHVCEYNINMSALSDFEKAHDTYKLTLLDGTNEECLRMLVSGRADIVIGKAPDDPSAFYTRTLMPLENVAIVCSSSPLARKDVLCLDDLVGQKVYFPVDPLKNGWMYSNALTRDEIHIANPSMMGSYAQNDRGIALTERGAAKSIATMFDGVVLRELSDDIFISNLEIIATADRANDEAIRAFFAYCAENKEKLLLPR